MIEVPIMVRCSAPLASLAALLLLTPLAQAQPEPDAKLSALEPHEAQEFGYAVALAGAVAVVGAPGDDPEFHTLEYGAVYVHRYDGFQWGVGRGLTKPQPELFDRFGKAVAVAAFTGTDTFTYTLLVGMSNDEEGEPGAGAVYVYQSDGSTPYQGDDWTHEATLLAPDGAEGDNFGAALAVQGVVDAADYTVWRSVVGAPRHSLTGFNREGAVYLYRTDEGAWIEEAKLTASDPGPAANFGIAVAISGDRILIGASGDDGNGAGQNAGAAYVFEHDDGEWIEKAKLVASDAEGQAAFGGAVALDGDRALIGARLDDEIGGGAGAAYVFRFEGGAWIEEQKLTASDYSGFPLFGSTVALEGTQALVGAPNWAAPNANGTGKAYVFTYDETLEEWQEQEGFIPLDADIGDHFGGALALDGGVVLVGAPDHSLPEPGAGAVYVYGEPEPTETETPAPSVPAVLSAAAPNPFRSEARLTLTLARAEAVRVSLFDLLGREVRVLHDGTLPASAHRLTISADGLPSGIYVVRATAASFVEVRRVVVSR